MTKPLQLFLCFAIFMPVTFEYVALNYSIVFGNCRRDQSRLRDESLKLARINLPTGGEYVIKIYNQKCHFQSYDLIKDRCPEI